MNPLDTVAKQRDEAQTKLRQMSAELDAAKAEIKRLRGGDVPEGGGVAVSVTGKPIPAALVPVVPQQPQSGYQGHVPPHQMPAPAASVPVPEVPTVTPPKAKRSGIFGGAR
jgi:hypothetical protein